MRSLYWAVQWREEGMRGWAWSLGPGFVDTPELFGCKADAGRDARIYLNDGHGARVVRVKVEVQA